MAVAPGPGERLCRRWVYRPLAPRRGGKGLMFMEGGFFCGAGAEWTGRSRYLKRSVGCAGTDREAPHEGAHHPWTECFCCANGAEVPPNGAPPLDCGQPIPAALGARARFGLALGFGAGVGFGSGVGSPLSSTTLFLLSSNTSSRAWISQTVQR